MIQVTINNFKKFGGEKIELNKVNILAGENSGGKTSFIKFLLFLKQSLLPQNVRRNYTINSPMMDFGTYKDVIKDHKTNRTIQFEFKVSGEDYTTQVERFLDGDKTQKRRHEVLENIGVGWGNPVHLRITIPKDPMNYQGIRTELECEGLGKLSIKIIEDVDDHTVFRKDLAVELKFKPPGQKSLVIKGEATKNSFFTMINGDEIHKKGGQELLDKLAYLLLSQNYVDDFIETLDYINPIEIIPSRFVDLRDVASVSHLKGFNQVANYIHTNPDVKSIETLKSAIKELGLADDIYLKHSPGMPFGELYVVNDGVKSNVCDVGYGVGLQITILASALRSSRKCIIIEQPEIHLHPRLQAKFIEVLLKYGDKNQYIIETHSEHIIRKLQVLVKQKKYVSNETVNVFYFKNTISNFVQKHIFENDNTLNPAFPSGFFDSSYMLTQEFLRL